MECTYSTPFSILTHSIIVLLMLKPISSYFPSFASSLSLFRYYEGAKTKASTNIKDSAVVCNNTAAFTASAEEDVMEVDVICVKRANFVVKAMYYSLRPSLFQAYVDEKRRGKREEGRE